MGAVFALFAGFYFWAPKIIGLSFVDKLGNIHFWTLFVGVNLIIVNFYRLIFNKYFILVKLINKDIETEELDNNIFKDIDNSNFTLNNLPDGPEPDEKINPSALAGICFKKIE